MKVLQLANMNVRSGVASFVMNYYRHINRSKIQFDFLSCALSANNYADEIKRLGGCIFDAPNYKKYFFRYIRFINKVMADGNYDIIHCNQFLLSIVALILAIKNGIKTRIIHSHNSSISSGAKRLLVLSARTIWRFLATDFYACSEKAAFFLFGQNNKYTMVKYAIDTDKYKFNQVVRNKMRNELSLSSSAFVLGYIARFVKEKNHFFLLEVFESVLQENKNAWLLLVGDGQLKEAVEKRAVDLGLAEKIIFYGTSEQAGDLYSAMDVFVFPSIFEGLPVVGIEAQCAGLPVIASRFITSEMAITDLVTWLDLKDGAAKWAKKILEYKLPLERKDTSRIITEQGYNINEECKKLEMAYFRLAHIV